MARYVVKRFVPGWGAISRAVRDDLGWGIADCLEVFRARSENGVFVSPQMHVNEAIRVAAAFELSGCEVDVEE